MSLFNQPITWDSQLIRAYDLAGPRYTSYPTAPQFRESFSGMALQNAIARSNQSGRPLSLYFHIPFCDTLCYYCGCNKVVTHNKNRALPYLERMIREMALYANLIDHSRSVTQLHWGGGTPTFISDSEMSMLMHATRRLFNLDRNGEFSIEIHPGRVSISTMKHLRTLGFNRVSMGIQDFDARVQLAVNRFNSVAQVSDLVHALRQQAWDSISMDLIYGLPFQTLRSMSDTLDKIIDLSPDRLSVFNYAHMPHLFKSQQLINEQDLPGPSQKLDMLHLCIERLQGAGYIYIGMDHFAKPDDDLAIAQQQGRMQRNFQGYSTHGDCDLLAFGVSSISRIDNVYLQNAKELNAYQQKLDMELLPFERGFTLNDEDELRRYVINQLICHFHLDFSVLSEKFDIDAAHHFSEELQKLSPMIEDGLLSIHPQGIEVHNKGRMLIRRICMVFDEYLNNNQQIRYSKII